MRVQNKSIIVTGAGNGIGEGIAKRLAQEGAQVLVNDINTTGGQRVVAEITAAGGKAAFFQADVTQSAQVQAMVAEAAGDFFVIIRDDGIKQWAYKGRALYTFAGDLAPGDANGTGVDPKLAVAAVALSTMRIT